MYKLFLLFLLSLVKNVPSQDNHNCNVDSGYSWCDFNKKCLNRDFEPCIPITKECIECLTMNFGDNTNCGPGCSMARVQEIQTEGFLGTDINGCIDAPGISWCNILNTCISGDAICPEEDNNDCGQIVCPMFCENGYKINQYGCNICKCDITSHHNTCPLDDQICRGHKYVCPVLREITHCSTGGISGYTTYELSLRILDESVYNIYALFGDRIESNDIMYVPASYQEDNIFNSDFGGVPEEIIQINPNLRYDSWLTIGLINGDPQHKISSIGIDFSEWNSNKDLIVDNGAIFLLEPNERITAGRGDDYVIAQLTIGNDYAKQAIFNVQGKTMDGGTWAEKLVVFSLRKSSNSLIGH